MASTLICFSCLLLTVLGKSPTSLQPGTITSYGPMPKSLTDRISQRLGLGLQVPCESISGHEFRRHHFSTFFAMPRTLRIRAVLTGTRIRITTTDYTDTGHSNKGDASDIAVPHTLFGHSAADLPTSATQTMLWTSSASPATAQTSHARLLASRVTSTVCDGLGVGREVSRPNTPNGVIFSPPI
ncbi:hypothetical protein B0T09DRAFT_174009 [Sordaria sp. MPI-SDFR-AT-0083]|nr:hypothetical protein B0T09DRAFT_174009 [Sordaria sp. MPI-SDFR-AT-0083]